MPKPKNDRWDETIIRDSGPYDWIYKNLFPDSHWSNDAFESNKVLYYAEEPPEIDLMDYVVFGPWRPARFSPAELEDAIVQACRAEWGEPSTFWWQVNNHDNLSLNVERVGIYSFDDPLALLFLLLEKYGAMEGGACYAGLLDRQYRWALAMDHHPGGDFTITVAGTAAFCERVVAAVGEEGQP